MPFINAGASPFVAGGPRIPVQFNGAQPSIGLAEFTLASDATGTYQVPIRLPRGGIFLRGGLLTSVTLGTAQVAIGIVGATGKYRAAAVLTATEAWQDFSLSATVGQVLAAEEQIIMTTTVAALPAAGRLFVRMEWIDNA
jgi:hypothetical protein